MHMKRVLLAIIAIGFCLSMKANTDSHPETKSFPQSEEVLRKLEMAEEYLENEKYKKAESIYLDAYKICKKNLPDSYEEYTEAVGGLFSVYFLQEKYKKAESILLENLQVCEDYFTIEEYMMAAEWLEDFYDDIGDYKKSRQYSMLAMGKMDDDNEKTEDDDGLMKYTHMAMMYMKMLQSEKEKGSPEYALYTSLIGSFYVAIGDWKRGEDNLLEALKMYNDHIVEHPSEPITKEDSLQYELSNTMLGVLYTYTGDYTKAEKYFLISTNLVKERAGESAEYEHTLTSLGLLYKKMGDYKKAEYYLSRSLKADEANTKGYAVSLTHLGEVYLLQHDYDQAERYLVEAFNLYNELNNKEYAPLMTYCMDNLAMVYIHKQNYSVAQELLSIVLQIQGYYFGTNHPDYITSLNHLGELYYETHEYNKAASCYFRTRNLQKRTFIHSVDFMTELQRSRYWETIKDRYERLYPNVSYRYYAQNKEISTFAYDNELYTKGLLLTSSNAVRQSIMDSKDSTLIQDWETLMNLRNRLTYMQQNGSPVDSLTMVEQYAEKLEKKVTKASAEYRENMRQWNITWDSVRAVLKPNQVAIEFMRAPLNEDSTMYCALLLRHDSEYPELIPLFEEKQVTRLLHNSTGDSAKINTTYLYGRNGDTLTRLIWGNILPRIHKGDEIYISPTHLLHQIAIEHLPYDETHTMNEVYSIVRLSSTRELVLPEKPIPHEKATLYGGIEYRALSDEVMAYNNQLYAKRDLSAPQEESQRQLHGYYAWPLKGTQKEVDAIAPILKSQKIAVTIYSDFSACEESVKGLSGQKQNILHFATHGMYVDTLTTNDPLDRCLLTFAGANRALIGSKVPEGMDDGILTAKEISVLDFREADIVVMSACETGLGDVSGEGVFGLQRAFKMAGAQTILMALWRVDDKATQMLMTAFYRYYSKGISKREAFRKAQQEVRSYTEKKTVERIIPPTQQEIMANQGKIVAPKTEIKTVTVKPYEAPYFWAGFILLD